MSTPRSSVLVPLTQKINTGTSTTGLLNPSVGTSLSSTPSPTVTPSFSQSLRSLENMTVPTLSPAPSPSPVSSSLVSPQVLPLINVSSSMPPSPELAQAQSKISQTLSNLQAMPPSPELGVSSPPLSMTPELTTASSGLSPALSTLGAEDKIQSSLANLRSLPPSPSISVSRTQVVIAPPSPVLTERIGSSLANLKSMPPSPSFSTAPASSERLPSTPETTPITLPTLPITPRASLPDDVLKPLSNEPTTVAPDSPSTASFHNYQGMIKDKGVEQTLTETGYLPVDKILTKDENGNLMCQYIKAVDPTGRSVFIDLDCEGYVAVDPKDMTMTTMSNASVVPYSIKMGTYECASSDVCGVAFECDNEICTLKRSDNSLTPSETVFTSVSMPEMSSGHKEHGMISNQPIAYPIVTLSDIKANPDQVSCSIKDSHNRMRNISFGQAKKETESLVDATKDLNNEIRRYEINHKIISGTLARTIRELETIHEQYKRSPPSNDDERAKLRLVYHNLRKRHDLVVDHLKLSESVNSRVDRIKELSGEVRSLNDYAEKLFSGIDGVYRE